MKLTKRPKFFDKRQVRNSDVDVFRDGLVLREHGQDDALSGLVENGQDLGRSLGQEVGQNFSLRGEDVVVDLEAGAVLFAHLSDALTVEVVSAAVDVGPEEVAETVEDLSSRPGHADVFANRAASSVFEVLDGLKHVDAIFVVDVETAVSGALSSQTAFPTRRLVVVIVGVVILFDTIEIKIPQL